MITPEQKVEIVRLYFAEHWKVGTIAAQLGLHHDVIRVALGLDSKRASGPPRARLIDPYLDFIIETLTRYPTLCATRLYDMLKARGYAGAVRSLRDHIIPLRPRPRREVFLRTEPLIGEQSQVDWAYVGKLPVAGGERAVWLFVLVLSHSRAMWGEFVFDLSVYSLCQSLCRAARDLGGVTRQWLFDNPKTVVVERVGMAVRFHPMLLDLCAEFRVQPRLCAVARPQHKGRVERSIRYLRDRFLSGRTLTSIPAANAELRDFIGQIAHARPHPTLAPRTVAEVFATEQPQLLSLPDPLPATDRCSPVRVDSQAFVQLDTNRYSVPTAWAGRTLTLVADDVSLRILDGASLVAQHVRCFGRRQIIEEASHREALLEQRRAARDLKGRDRIRAIAPDFTKILERWAVTGRSLAIQVTRTIKLVDLYGEDVFREAVTEVVARGLYAPSAIAVACEKRRRERALPVPVDIDLPDHIADRDVIPHDLERYDGKR